MKDCRSKPPHLLVSATSHIGMGGKQWVEDLIAPLNTGLVTNQMCIEAGDPIGLHHLQVRAGGKVIYSVDFEVAPDDGFYEWKPEATAPAQTGAAKVEKFSDTAPRRKAEDRQATKAATPPAATAK